MLQLPMRRGIPRGALTLLLVTLGSVSSLAATISFNPDRDTPLVGTLPNHNFGGATILATGTVGGQDERSLLSFDVSALDGLYDQIDSITLRLTVQGTNSGPNSQNPEVHAVTTANRDWIEGTGDNNGASNPVGLHTWNNRVHPGTPWAGSPGLSTPGTDYDATVLSSLSFASGNLPTNGTALDFTFAGTSAELTALIDGWLLDNVGASQPNAGLLLFDPGAGSFNPTERIRYFAIEGSGAAPELIIEYTESAMSQIPEPGSLALVSLLGMVSSRQICRRRFRRALAR